MAVVQRYPTKPLETYAKSKELRQAHTRHLGQKTEGRVDIMMLSETIGAIPAGFDDYANHAYAANIERITEDSDTFVKCVEAWEARTFGRDACAMCRVHVGSMFLGLNRNMHTGEQVKPTLAFQVHICNNSAKAVQMLSEYYGIPYRTVDLGNPFQSTRSARQFVVGQILDAIEFMSQVSGQEYHDEKLIQAVYNEWRTLTTWSRIYLLQTTVPAPLDVRMLHALLQLVSCQKEKKEVADFFQELYAEVQERVKEGISARGFEQARLMLYGVPPSFYPQILRYPEKYGAVLTASKQGYTCGAWVQQGEDETSRIPLTPQERGLELKTREDAANSLAELCLEYVPNFSEFNPSRNVDGTWRQARDWKVDGFIYHMDRGCNGLTALGPEVVKELQRHGIPTMVMEGNQADPRDFDLAQAQNTLDSFLESLGLTPIGN